MCKKIISLFILLSYCLSYAQEFSQDIFSQVEDLIIDLENNNNLLTQKVVDLESFLNNQNLIILDLKNNYEQQVQQYQKLELSVIATQIQYNNLETAYKKSEKKLSFWKISTITLTISLSLIIAIETVLLFLK